MCSYGDAPENKPTLCPYNKNWGEWDDTKLICQFPYLDCATACIDNGYGYRECPVPEADKINGKCYCTWSIKEGEACQTDVNDLCEKGFSCDRATNKCTACDEACQATIASNTCNIETKPTLCPYNKNWGEWDDTQLICMAPHSDCTAACQKSGARECPVPEADKINGKCYCTWSIKEGEACQTDMNDFCEKGFSCDRATKKCTSVERALHPPTQQPTPTPCSGCLGIHASCDEACKQNGHASGTCAHPTSTDPGKCCACHATPAPTDCSGCIKGDFSSCDAVCKQNGHASGTCDNPGSTDPGKCCACHATPTIHAQGTKQS